MKVQWSVQSSDDQKSLIQFLQERLKDRPFSRRKIKGFIDAGYCFIQKKSERFSRAKLRAGSCVTLCIPKSEKNEICTIYEDEAILVINKPHSTTCDERLEKALSCHLVHRLDKDTTGLLLLAKTVEFRDMLMQQFQERTVKKGYVAIVEGAIDAQGTIKNHLGPIARAQGMVKWGPVANGHYAETHWTSTLQTKETSFVKLKPETGRTHQLRVHLAGIGHPIIGDHLYGSRTIGSKRYLLHAYSLQFNHPKTSKALTFEAPLAQDMVEAGFTYFRKKLCIF